MLVHLFWVRFADLFCVLMYRQWLLNYLWRDHVTHNWRHRNKALKRTIHTRWTTRTTRWKTKTAVFPPTTTNKTLWQWASTPQPRSANASKTKLASCPTHQFSFLTKATNNKHCTLEQWVYKITQVIVFCRVPKRSLWVAVLIAIAVLS